MPSLTPFRWCLTVHYFLYIFCFFSQFLTHRRGRRREIIKRKPQTIITTNASRSNSEDIEGEPKLCSCCWFLLLTFYHTNDKDLECESYTWVNAVWASLSIWRRPFNLGALGRCTLTFFYWTMRLIRAYLLLRNVHVNPSLDVDNSTTETLAW